MIRARHPEVAERLYQQLQGNRVATPSVAAVHEAQRHLAEKGYQCPEWDLVWNGARPDQGSELEPGEWKHGWQYYAASRLETEFRAGAVLSSADYSSNALLRSQAGRASGAHLSALPVDAARTWQPAHLRLVLLRRLRLELPLDERRCKCGGVLDSRGDHRAACPTVGKLAQRAKPLEQAWARVCREAGARVLENCLLRDLNLEGVAGTDGRRLEVVANNLPLWNGAQLGVDCTLVSPLRRDGTAYPRAAATDGVRLEAARQRKENKYPELLNSRRCKLVMTVMEIGGRWSEEAWSFLEQLAKVKAKTVPVALRRSTEYCFLRRWSQMLGVAAQSAFAATLLGEPAGRIQAWNDQAPDLGEALRDRETPAEGPSRLR